MKHLLVFILFLFTSKTFAVNCQWTDKTTYGEPTSGIAQEIKVFSSTQLFDTPPLAFDLSKAWGFE